MSTDAISPLRQRMIEDMSGRKLNPRAGQCGFFWHPDAHLPWFLIERKTIEPENPSHHGAGHGFMVSRISMIQVFADGADDGDPFVDGNVLRSHTMRTVG